MRFKILKVHSCSIGSYLCMKTKKNFTLLKENQYTKQAHMTVKVMQQTNVSNMTRLVCTMAFKAMLLIRFEIGGYLSEAPAGE